MRVKRAERAGRAAGRGGAEPVPGAAGRARRVRARRGSGATPEPSRAKPTRAQRLSAKPPLRRLFWAIGRLRAGKSLKATDLAQEFEVNVRTAYRDLDFLRDEWRVPLEYDRQAASYRLTEPVTSLPAVTLSQGELVALYFAEKVLAQYRGTPFEDDLVSAFGKIQDLLPEQLRVSAESLDAYLSLDPGPLHTPDAEVFRAVLAAQRAHRQLRVRYRSLNSGRETRRRVHPYHVFNHRGDWYVAAWDERRRDVRVFALHRFLEVELLEEDFEPEPGFDLGEYLKEAFAIQKGGPPVAVVVRFAPRQARWIRERRWHHSARVEELAGGGVLLRLAVAPTSEIRRWVMQFGSEAEVVAPPGLRREVEQELAAAARAYRKRGGSPPA